MLMLREGSIYGDQLACLLAAEHAYWEQHRTWGSAYFRHPLLQGPSGPSLSSGGLQRLRSIHSFFAGVRRRSMGGVNKAVWIASNIKFQPRIKTDSY